MKAQAKIIKAHTEEIGRLREEHVEEIVACKATSLENQATFRCERNEAIIRVTLRTAERDSAHARFHMG